VQEYVYFAQAGTNGPIKIGTSRNLTRRIAAMQMYSPHGIRLLATEPGGVEAERAYHHRFNSAALAGEWFQPTPELLALIAQIVERNGPPTTRPNPKRRRPGTGSNPMRNFRLDDERWARVTAAAGRKQTTASDVLRELVDTLPPA
jgi:hypothetical protein